MVASYILPVSKGWKNDQLSSPQVDIAKQAESRALASDSVEIWKVKPPKGWEGVWEASPVSVRQCPKPPTHLELSQD